MTGKIFFRKRQRCADGAGIPRYLLMAVEGADLEVYGQHLRMSELKAIAEATGTELIDGTQQPIETSHGNSNSWGQSPRTLEFLLLEAAGKAQFLLDAGDADETALLSLFTEAEREQFVSLLMKFVEKEPKNWIS